MLKDFSARQLAPGHNSLEECRKLEQKDTVGLEFICFGFCCCCFGLFVCFGRGCCLVVWLVEGMPPDLCLQSTGTKDMHHYAQMP